MEGARGVGWQAVDFDTAEATLFQLDFEFYRRLTRNQKRKCIAQEGVMADEEQMFFILKTDQTGNDMVDRVFGSEFGKIIEPIFQTEGFGDNLRGLACSNERAGE